MHTFQVNAPKVVYELFDDEAVIVNLETGNYYSTQKSGAALWIWSRLVKNVPVEQIIGGLSQNGGTTNEQVSEAVWRFIEQLQEYSLIIPATTPSANSAQNSTGNEDVKETFPWNAVEPPVLVQYNDMQDLLMLDPIHDVDESGWPNPA